jgi:predicted transcriptional regulator
MPKRITGPELTSSPDPESAIKTAAEIVIAYLGHRVVEPEDLPGLVFRVRQALVADVDTHGEAAAAPAPPAVAFRDVKPSPAVSIEDSISPDWLISLEDGKRYRSLKRHLMAKHGLTPEDYRRKWGLPADYPMVAPNYSAERAAVAKRTGLGRTKPRAAGRSRRKAG